MNETTFGWVNIKVMKGEEEIDAEFISNLLRDKDFFCCKRPNDNSIFIKKDDSFLINCVLRNLGYIYFNKKD